RESEQGQLAAGRRWAELGAVELDAPVGDAGPLAGKAEPGPERVGPYPAWLQAGEEVRIVVAAPADRTDDRHYLVAALGEVGREPLAEERADLMGQAQGNPSGRGDAQGACAREDSLDEFIGDRRDHRRYRAVRGHARLDKLAERGKAPGGGGGAGFEQSGEAGIERGHRDRNGHEVPLRQLDEQVEVAQDAGRLGRAR